jgi:hypothetical protein
MEKMLQLISCFSVNKTCMTIIIDIIIIILLKETNNIGFRSLFLDPTMQVVVW